MNAWTYSVVAAMSIVGLAGCAAADTSRESAPAVTAESSILSTPAPAPSTSEPSPTSEMPDLATKAVAVATAGCYAGWIDNSPPFLYPRLLVGAVISFGISNGDIEWPPKDEDELAILHLDMWKTDYMTEAFQTAATLDPAYQTFADLWESGKTRAVKAWARGGIGSIDATRKGSAQLKKLEARCRVPIAIATEKAAAANTSVDRWVSEVGGSLLPAAYEPVEGNLLQMN